MHYNFVFTDAMLLRMKNQKIFIQVRVEDFEIESRNTIRFSTFFL
jgi:hypothetical protein